MTTIGVGTAPDYFAPLNFAINQYFVSDGTSKTDARRLFHGRGGCFPGLNWCVIDSLFPTVLVTVFESPPENFAERLLRSLQVCGAFERFSFTGLVIQHRNLPNTPCQWIFGDEPESSTAKRGDLAFHIRFAHQNIGYFLDMEPGRLWLERLAKDKSVLNLFAYTSAFSVVAHAAGAKKIVNVDMSSQALAIGRQNHQLNQQTTDNVQFLALDILKSWSRIRKPGPYNLIIIDPPSYQKGSFVASKDYVKVVRRITELAAHGADILACLNAPELSAEFLIDVFVEHCPECKFIARLPTSPEFMDIDERRQLKLLHFRFN